MISIIIPTYNEAENIGRLIVFLKTNGSAGVKEIIIVDGGSEDQTIQVAELEGVRTVCSPQKGRAAQMNYGAALATGDILYFIHADTLPPRTFVFDITRSVNNGFEFGRYRTKFESDKWILKINAFFTRFDLLICYGGDQTMFIKRKLFDAIGGFNENLKIMEDYDIVTRAKQLSGYKIMQKDTLVSARKYDTNSWLSVQKANYKIVRMYKKGASQQEMVDCYKRMLNYR